MHKFVELTLIHLLGFLAVFSVAAQPRETASVKWQPVIGHEKELVIFMPGGFRTVIDDSSKVFGRSRTKAVTVKKAVKIARLINGTLLLINYYEANGSALYEILSAFSGLSPVSQQSVGTFGIKRFAGKVRGQFVNTHYFIAKDRLYEATSYSSDENNPIAEAFLASTRLADGGTHIAPNATGNASSTPLPRIAEIEPERSPDTVRVDESKADRDAIILFQPALRSSSDQGVMPQAGKVTATAVLTAAGTVKEVKTGGNAPVELMQAFAKTIKNIVFIPAEKDGKLVSVVKKFSWEMTVEVRITGGGPPPFQ